MFVAAADSELPSSRPLSGIDAVEEDNIAPLLLLLPPALPIGRPELMLLLLPTTDDIDIPAVGDKGILHTNARTHAGTHARRDRRRRRGDVGYNRETGGNMAPALFGWGVGKLYTLLLLLLLSSRSSRVTSEPRLSAPRRRCRRRWRRPTVEQNIQHIDPFPSPRRRWCRNRREGEERRCMSSH